MGQLVGLSYFDKQIVADTYGPPVGFLDISTRGGDSNSALLQSTGDFTSSTTHMNTGLSVVATIGMGVESGWRPKKISHGSDGSVWLLRTNENGSIAVQKRSGTTVLSDMTYANPNGEQFVDFAVAPDGGFRLLQANKDGSWVLWDGDPTNNKYYSPANVPGNFAKAIAVGADNKTRVLIETIQGNAQFGCKALTLSAPTGALNGAGFTPVSTTTTLALTGSGMDIAVDSAGTIHVLWATQGYGGSPYSSSVQFSIWRPNGTSAYSNLTSAPNGANRPVGFTVGADSKIRVLWNNYASRFYFVDKYNFSSTNGYTFENETLNNY